MRVKQGMLHFLDVIAFFAIPATTLLFPLDTPWLSTNFSVVTWGREQQLDFLAWGLLVGGYFGVCLFLVLRTMSGRLLPATMLVLALYLLVQGLILPYLPVEVPWYASLHVVFNFSACALSVGAVLIVLLRLGRGNWRRYLPCVMFLVISMAGCALLFVRAGIITSGLEIWFVLSMTALIRTLLNTRMEELS